MFTCQHNKLNLIGVTYVIYLSYGNFICFTTRFFPLGSGVIITINNEVYHRAKNQQKKMKHSIERK